MVENAQPDWYLREWMDHFGKKQADLVKDLGWLKGAANKWYHGAHGYRREVVNELSAWLGIQPYEMLMPPALALSIRAMRESARQIAAEGEANRFLPPVFTPPRAHRKTGTHG